MPNRRYVTFTALIVALGGFLMGFDASVISGVVGFIEPEFALTKLQIGWVVSCLTLTSTLAMIFAGPLSDRWGRKPVLYAAALLYALSAITSAIAPSFWFLVVARMIGGFGVGASLIVAPMYIAEIAPPSVRGRMVSFNQLNIVLGISAAFFSNYLIVQLAGSDAGWARSLHVDVYHWRWMLGIETLPALLYFVFLFIVPESPRWLVLKGREAEALAIMTRAGGAAVAAAELADVKHSLATKTHKERIPFSELLKPAMRLVLTIGIVIAVVQQITGINAVFFYAPMIFQQTGIDTDASFSQAVLVGLVNLVFTIVAMGLVDRLGRKPLLTFGLVGILVSMTVLAFSFFSATYTLDAERIAALPDGARTEQVQQLQGRIFEDDISFKQELRLALGAEDAARYEAPLLAAAIHINSWLVLIGIVGFVASFAVSLGPVMWVLFSELFPNRIRGLAISFVGFINSAISFTVQLVFPWEMATLGSGWTFLIYGLFAAIGLVVVAMMLPETRGKSLEELETLLVREPAGV